MDENALYKKCAKPSCKKTLPADLRDKHCTSCRELDRKNQKACRERKKARATASSTLTEPRAGQKRHHDNTLEDIRPAQRARTESTQNGERGQGAEDDEDDEDDDIFGGLTDTVSIGLRIGMIKTHESVGCRELL